MTFTAQMLADACGIPIERAQQWADPLRAACALYSIDSPARLAMFLAQIGHESGGFRYVREVWGPTDAQRRYEGRRDLGNTEPGDGERYKGHGLIQITGRYNHRRARDRMRERLPKLDVPDFEADPERLCEPQWAALSAADYWDDRGLNALADAGQFDAVTRRINGGLNGLADRVQRLARAKAVLFASPPPAPEPARELAPDAAPAFLPATSQGVDAEQAGADAPQTKENAAMAPFIAAALPALIQAAPALIRIFGDSPQAEKNAKAAEVVAQVAMQATGADTVEGAVRAIETSPAKAAAYREAVHASIGEVLGAMQALNEMEQRNLAAARSFGVEDGLFLDTRWVKLRFVHVLSLVFVAFSGAFVIATWRDLTPELRGAVITLMVIAGWNGVRDYWMGSSSGSDRKTAMMLAESRRGDGGGKQS